MKRRDCLIAGASLLPAPAFLRGAWAAEPGAPLPIPPVAEAGGSGAIVLEAMDGQHSFGIGRPTAARGFSQPYLGPVLRVRRGSTARIDVRNRLRETLTVHWHGLHVPGEVDGGPHSAIKPGAVWQPALEIDQPASTNWYHSHQHGVTGPHVYSGLAGMLLVDDPQAREDGLPQRYGIDDLPLLIQDRAFSRDGQLLYGGGGMMAMMMGARGDHIIVNGAWRPLAEVPAGIVRLRLLNGSNARILHLRFEDGRQMHRVASDGGLLERPLSVSGLTLATGERAEVLVDFSSGGATRLLSGQDHNSPMGGMGGGMRGGMGGMGMGLNPPAVAQDGAFEVMRFRVEPKVRAAVTTIPLRLAHPAAAPRWGEPRQRRRFVLDSHGAMMGGGGMGGGRGRAGMGMMAMTINGQPFDMERIDLRLRRGHTELWDVSAGDMAHPFHVHGTSFQVLSHNGRPTEFAAMGLKDTVLVDGEVQLLMRFEHPATEHRPYMYHCHILEHEDAGMMGQFTVA